MKKKFMSSDKLETINKFRRDMKQKYGDEIVFNEGEAKVELYGGQHATGSVASKLLNNGFSINALRTNDILLYDEWKAFDEAVVGAAQKRAVGFRDLMQRGLVYNTGTGLSKTVLAYQDASDMNGAELTMDAISKTVKDRLDYDIKYLPLPIIHKDFSISARVLEESRKGGMPIDTSHATLSAFKVMEMAENILFNGASAYTFGGGTIRGYTDHANRLTASLGTAWSSDTGENILTDVLAMKQDSIDALHFGDWGLYVPTSYETAMDEDFKATSDISTRERLLKIKGISQIEVADQLPDGNVVLVQFTEDVVRAVNALPIMTTQWSTDGGFMIHFKILMILVPQIRAKQDGKIGLVHYSV